MEFKLTNDVGDSATIAIDPDTKELSVLEVTLAPPPQPSQAEQDRALFAAHELKQYEERQRRLKVAVVRVHTAPNGDVVRECWHVNGAWVRLYPIWSNEAVLLTTGLEFWPYPEGRVVQGLRDGGFLFLNEAVKGEAGAQLIESGQYPADAASER